ncbi:hypothetical protein JTB14_002972 [Gonioctena quinquepunctata]|nr:hypothetical protein JTB14_002972 [Gonioctena quinquepunctata]
MLDQVNKSPDKFPDWKIDGGILYKHLPLSYGFRSNFPEWKGSFYGKIQPPGDISFEEDRSKYGEEIDKLSDLYLDVRSRLSEAYVKNSRQYNLRKRPGENYQIGDEVWKKNHVLSNAAEGFAAKLALAYIFCTVHRVISPLVYQLVDKDGKNVGKYHMKDLKRYRGSEDEDQ